MQPRMLLPSVCTQQRAGLRVQHESHVCSFTKLFSCTLWKYLLQVIHHLPGQQFTHGCIPRGFPCGAVVLPHHPLSVDSGVDIYGPTHCADHRISRAGGDPAGSRSPAPGRCSASRKQSAGGQPSDSHQSNGEPPVGGFGLPPALGLPPAGKHLVTHIGACCPLVCQPGLRDDLEGAGLPHLSKMCQCLSPLLEGKGLGPFLGHSWGRLKQIFGILADTVGLPSQPQDCVLRELLRTEGKVLPLGLRWDHCIHLSLIHTRAPSADWSLLAPGVLGKGRRWRSNAVSSACPGGGLLVLVPELAR